MADYKPGSMNIKAQEATFAGFLTFVKWAVILTILVLIFLALVDA